MSSQFAFASTGNTRSLAFTLRGNTITHLHLKHGYPAPVPHDDKGNSVGLNNILSDCASAITGKWTILRGSGELQPPVDAANIFGDGLFSFESPSLKLLQRRSVTSGMSA